MCSKTGRSISGGADSHVSDTDPPDTSREMDTDPLGLAPPAQHEYTPDDMLGAPPYFRALMSKLDKVLANQEMSRRDHSTFKVAVKSLMHNIDVEIEWLKEGQKSSDEQHVSTSTRLRKLEAQVKNLEDLVIGDEGL